MVIFRIIRNLFGIVMRLGFSLLWLPVFILTRHLFLTVVIVGIVIYYLFIHSDDQSVKSSRNANPASIAYDAHGNKIQIATPVRKLEDGDSAFANDLYRQMTDIERAYYSQFFFWAMGNVPDGQTHSWSNLDIGGAITPTNSFANKSGARCRHFTEVLKVHAVQQNITGIACDNGGGSWCKLKANATPACGLGHSPDFMESVSDSFGKIF